MSGSITQVRPTIAYDFETLTVSNDAVGLTATKYRPSTGDANKNALKAFITAEGGSVRYRYDGTDPTSTVGHILEAGGFLIADGQHQMEKIRFIRTGNSDGVLQVSYERE